MTRRHSITINLIYIVTLFSLVVSMGFVALYLTVGPSLPEVESIRQIRLQTPMRVYAKDQQLIAEFGDTKRIPITLDQVPKDFINALLSTEDQRFYQHSGVDLLGVLRAFVNLATTGRKSQGASTITMLVARNYYLTRAKRFSRKITEMFLAWKIESELSKDEILELFLNKIHFSHHAYGLGAASQIYYGTTLDQLSLAKLATLAGIPKGESTYNPISNPEKARERRAHVLGRMLSENHITQSQYDEANAEPIETKKHGLDITVSAPHFAEMVRSEIVARFGIDAAYNDGLNVYTTLDPQLQHYAIEATQMGLEEYDRRHGYRGPEMQFPGVETASESQLLDWLRPYNSVANLQPALVISVNDEQQSAIILLKDNTQAELVLEDLKWARAYVDENHRGAPITKVSQVLTQGDLVRVSQQQTESNGEVETHFKLAQIPDASAGFVSLVPDNGAIEALVGGYDFFHKKFNTVTQANRQLGSNIKPFIYSAAFEKGFSPASIINDMPIVEEDISAENFWRPKNDNDQYAGPTSLRVGLRNSKNTVSIRLIRKVGPEYTKDYLQQIGLPGEKMQPFLSLALGSASFTPLEVVTAYSVLANDGYKVNPWFIQKVEDSQGNLIQQHQPVRVCRECEILIADHLKQVAENTIDAQQNNNEPSAKTISEGNLEDIADNDSTMELTAGPLLPIPQEYIAPRVIDRRNRFLIDNILKEVIHRGTAFGTLYRAKSNLLKRNDLAGKTGTTNDSKDAWFSGYNVSHVATAWVGFDDHAKKLGTREWGGRSALPIWRRFMEQALDSEKQRNHPTPEGIVTVKIDPKTGLLASIDTEKPIFEVFREENAPTEYAKSAAEDIYNQTEEKVEEESLF